MVQHDTPENETTEQSEQKSNGAAIKTRNQIIKLNTPSLVMDGIQELVDFDRQQPRTVKDI